MVDLVCDRLSQPPECVQHSGGVQQPITSQVWMLCKNVNYTDTNIPIEIWSIKSDHKTICPTDLGIVFFLCTCTQLCLTFETDANRLIFSENVQSNHQSLYFYSVRSSGDFTFLHRTKKRLFSHHGHILRAHHIWDGILSLQKLFRNKSVIKCNSVAIWMVNNDELIRGRLYKHKQICDIGFAALGSNCISDLHPE